MTEREVEINLVLEKFGGDRAQAAVALGVTDKALKAALNNNPALKERWRKRTHKESTTPAAASPGESLNRLSVPAQTEMSEEERKMAEAMMREDDLLREGLEKLNLTEQEQQLAMEYAAFNNKYFVKSADICMSGITVLGMKLQTEAMDRKTRLDEVRGYMRQYFTPTPPEPSPPVDSANPQVPPPAPPPTPVLPFSREQLAEEEKTLMTAYDTLCDTANRLANTHLKAMMLQAMVKFRLRNPGAQTKPGYQEKLINGNGKH